MISKKCHVFLVLFISSFTLLATKNDTVDYAGKLIKMPKSIVHKSTKIDNEKQEYDVLVDSIKIFSGRYNNTGNHIADISYIAYI